MRLIKKDKMLADGSFCMDIACCSCSLSYINESDHRMDCRVFKWIREQSTIQAVPIEVLQEIRDELTKHYVDPYNRNAFRYTTVSLLDVLDLIDKHIKEYTNETDN